MHSDFWATEIKEDESGKKIIKIKDLAYNLEAVAEVMGNEIFIRTASDPKNRDKPPQTQNSTHPTPHKYDTSTNTKQI